jgi:hypothetical protein
MVDGSSMLLADMIEIERQLYDDMHVRGVVITPLESIIVA